MKPKYKYINLNKKIYKVKIKKNLRAKKIILRISNVNPYIYLTIPKNENEKNAIDFLFRNKEWVLNELKRIPKKILFLNNSEIPYMGVTHRIVYAGEYTNLIYIYDKKIMVFGKKEEISKNLKNWLYHKAKIEILKIAKLKVSFLNKKYNKIKIKDLKSSWGTCGENGNLSFSWRLILAPKHVMEYIVVHELCHLVELNHSKKFWILVTELFPQKKLSQDWLKTNGTYLHTFD
ncbi:MAG: hypothetical protein CMM18_00890 [Rhodospirillaceae bacterium]|nr:hypothetical protein [Rhodospirillaceae bacterium]